MSQQTHSKIAIMLAILCTTSIATRANEIPQEFSPLCPTFQPGFQRLADYQTISDHKKITEDSSFHSRTSAPGGSSLLTALNGLATSLSNLATAPIMNSTALARSQSSTNTINSLLMPFSKNLDSNSIAPLLQALNNSTSALKAASLNSNFSTSNRGVIASSLLNASTLFNNVAYSSNFSVQSDIDTAATSAIAFVAILDALATQWSVTGSLNSTNTNARSSLAAFSTLTSGVYVYTAGTASVAQIKTASSTIAAYVAQLMSLKSFAEYITPTGYFFGLTFGPDGNLWATDVGGGKNVCKITTSGDITNYSSGISDIIAGITVGPDGNLWFTDWGAGKIGTITTSGSISTYTVSGASGLQGIVTGSDGNLWFCNVFNNAIGKITTSGTVTQYSLPSDGSSPRYIAAGADGNLWFTENDGNRIGKITPSGDITEFITPSSPWGITAGPDGNIWFAETASDKIGKITPTGTITEYALPSGYSALTLIFDPKGYLWCKGDGTSLVRMDIQTGTMTPFATPSSAQSYGMAFDTTGNLWYTEYGISKIGTLQLP